MSNLILLTISGWKGSGKDTVSDYLFNNYGVIKLSLANALKESVSKEYEIDINDLNDRVKKESPIAKYPVYYKDDFSKNIIERLYKEFRTINNTQPKDFYYQNNNMYCSDTGEQLYWTPRALCILRGSVNRSIDSNYWVKKIAGDLQPNKIYIISDVRYKSEIEGLRDALSNKNGKLVTIRINRFENIFSDDESERNLDDYNFDYYINNSIKENVTIDQLYKQVDEIYKNILKL